jgi:hypothetical protein
MRPAPGSSGGLPLVHLAFLVALALPRVCVSQENRPPALDKEFAEELSDSADVTGSAWATALLVMEGLEALYQIYMYFTVFAVKREHELCIFRRMDIEKNSMGEARRGESLFSARPYCT